VADDLFREVEEEVRKERYEQLWKDYGTYIIGAAAALIIAVGGWQAWQSYQLSQRQDASARFEAAQQTAQAGDLAGAETAFQAIVNDAPEGYQSLARFRLAELQMAQNKRDEGLATLRELTRDPEPLLQAAARMRLAWTVADTAPRAELDALIEPLSGADNPWRFNAAELRAYLDYHSGNRDQAQAAYARLATEAEAPTALRQRASQISQYLSANPRGAPTSPGQVVPASPAPAAPAPPAPAAPAPAAPAAPAPPVPAP
jgi:hypothetical protein